MKNASTAHDTIIIDVRSPMEYASGHVEGSLNLPLDRFVDAYANVIQEKAKQVVVYCASGARSGQAVQFLLAQGYANAVNGVSCRNVASSLNKSVV
jgi:phage shock protein E